VRDTDSSFSILDRFLDAPRDELLDLLRGGAGPIGQGQRHADRNVRILALRHREESVDAPQACGDEQHPRHVPRLREIARGVVRVRDDVGV
jgi:hypothetical protein